MCPRRNFSPFKSESIGSLVRTDELLRAKRRRMRNSISKKEYERIKFIEIKKVIDKQISYGLKSVTDGEFSREWSNYDFFSEIKGITEDDELPPQYKGRNKKPMVKSVTLCDRLHFSDHSVISDFEFLKKVVSNRAIPKVTLPAPSMLLFDLLRASKKEKISVFYPSVNLLIEEIATCCQNCLERLYSVGCRVVQMDNSIWGLLIDPNMRKVLLDDDENFEKLLQMTSELNILSFSKKPKDMIINMYVSKKEYSKDWIFSGNYESISHVLFKNPFVNGIYLEFDNSPNSSFEILKYAKNYQKISLGLISTDKKKLDDDFLIQTKIMEAAQYISLDRLSLSPQSGFSPNANAPFLSENDQWSKIEQMVRIANNVWK